MSTGQPSAARRMLGDFAPKLVELTDDVLFGTSGSAPTSLHGTGASSRPPRWLPAAMSSSCRSTGKQNGLTETEIVEAITHLAFYCGWPMAMSAIGAAKQALAT